MGSEKRDGKLTKYRPGQKVIIDDDGEWIDGKYFHQAGSWHFVFPDWSKRPFAYKENEVKSFQNKF